MTLPRVLWSIAATFALTGLGLRIAPAPRAPAPADAVPVRTLLGRPTAPAAADSGRGIVAANVFSVARTAPRVRFTPPGAGAPAHAPAPTRPAFTLYGITVTAEGGGAIALIDADPRIPGAEIYRVNDLVGGARLSVITDSTVTLVQPSGPLVLRLPPGSRRKS